MAVGIVGILFGAKASQKHTLQPEKLSLLLGVEKLEVGVVDHVQPPALLPRLLVADDNLFAKLIEGVLVGIRGKGSTVSTAHGYDNSQTRSSKWLTRSDATLCLLYTSPSPRDRTRSRMPSSA